RRKGDRRFRPQSRDSLPRRAFARKANPRDAPPAHQQRQCLPRPPQTVAQPLQPRRHQEPAKLSRMAPRSRSLGRQTPAAKLDQRRHRKRTIPTANALRAELYVGKSGNVSYITRNHRNKDPARRRGSALETNCFGTCDASRKAADFFTCFGYNPLKSIDSAKEIQINPRVFIWISLDFLAASSRPGC